MITPVAGMSLASAHSIGLDHAELLAAGVAAEDLWARAQKAQMCVRSLAINLAVMRQQQLDAARDAGYRAPAAMRAALKALGFRAVHAHKDTEFELAVSPLADVRVMFDPATNAADVRAEYMGQAYHARQVQGAAALSAAVGRAQSGLQEFRRRRAVELVASQWGLEPWLARAALFDNRDSAGRLIHPCPGGVGNFWRWFCGSKAVDAGGLPMLWFHGTDASQDFEAFDITSDIGFHFGSAEQANAAAARTCEGSERVLPVYLCIRNPLRLPDLHTWSAGDVVSALRGVVLSDEQLQVAQELEEIGHEQVRDWLEAAGYDSIVYANETEGSGDSVIVLRPEQIKSAVGGDGRFDAADPRLVGQAPMDALARWEDVLGGEERESAMALESPRP